MASGLLCLILVVLFWPVFFQGKVLVPGDIPTPTPSSRGPGIQHLTAGTPCWPTRSSSSASRRSLAAAKLQHDGSLPLWNPYIYTGQPLVANAPVVPVLPPNLLLRFLSPGKVATVRVLFNFLCAGLFTFLFCRELQALQPRGLPVGGHLHLFRAAHGLGGYPLANV